MERILLLVFSNAVVAAIFAAGVGLIAMKLRRPAVLHILWIVVLLRLFAPPLYVFGIMPALSSGVSFGSLVLNPVPASAEMAVPSADPRVLLYLVFGVWLLGSLVIAAMAVVRTRRFRVILNGAEVADPVLESRILQIAETLKCRRIPRTVIVDDRISPMIWSAFTQPVLVLPRGLMERLTDSQFDTIIAHEIAHLKRGDHRLRWVELAAIVVFWWNPVTWWACRGLRQSEEECCDAIVVSALPNRVRDYASSLVESVRQLAVTAWPVDVVSPLNKTRSIERRIKTMFTQNNHGKLSKTARFGLILGAVFALGLTPMLTAREGDKGSGNTFKGDPITLQLKNAELRDVLTTFSELTRIDILTEPSVKGTVTLNIVDTPWDEALDRILRENNLVYSIEGGHFIVRNADSKPFKPLMKRPLEGLLDDEPIFRYVPDGDITKPKKTEGPPPKYPGETRKEGISGVVVLDCTLGADGKVHELDVLKSPDNRLSDAALEAVRQWTFEPSTLDGKPVAVKYIVTVKFALK